MRTKARNSCTRWHGAAGTFFLALWLFFSANAFAQSYSVLHSFAFYTDAAKPEGSLIQAGSLLYGLTYSGGPQFYGGIFSIDPATKSETVLHYFDPYNYDGTRPKGSLTQSGSVLYGTTMDGGTYNDGTIIAFNTVSNTESVVHSFGVNVGPFPMGALIESGSVLYGTTIEGGSPGGGGAIFGFNERDGVLSLLHQFAGGTTDGARPSGALTQAGSVLYGMTQSGGTSGKGTLFALDGSSGRLTLLHSFTGGADGGNPSGSLIQSGSTLYGMTPNGGDSGLGTIFAFNTASETETVLHSFSGGNADGATPYGSLIQSGSTLFGMTNNGGSADEGTVFALDIPTGSFTILHAFNGSDGANPTGDLLLSNGTLYGMTENGGDSGVGVVFALSVPEPASAAWIVIAASLLVIRKRARGR